MPVKDTVKNVPASGVAPAVGNFHPGRDLKCVCCRYPACILHNKVLCIDFYASWALRTVLYKNDDQCIVNNYYVYIIFSCYVNWDISTDFLNLLTSPQCLCWFTMCKGLKSDILCKQSRVTRPFYWYCLTVIPRRVTNYMPSKVWDEMTYPFPNFNTIEFWECNYMSLLWSKLIHFSKRAPSVIS